MPTQLEKAREYLDVLEAKRLAALALSEQKAEEAKLIKARLEGFQAAMEMLGDEISSSSSSEPGANVPGRERVRRSIRQLILRELSFSGRAMTTAQIAKAIEYQSTRTETALGRLEAVGQVVRGEQGGWAIGIAAMDQLNTHMVTATNGKGTGWGTDHKNGGGGE
jgi:hypothetical protein